MTTPTTPQSPPADAERDLRTSARICRKHAEGWKRRLAYGEAAFCEEVADELDQGANAITTLTADRDAALAEVKRLREALKPFAAVSESSPEVGSDFIIGVDGADPDDPDLTWGDFHRARAARDATSKPENAS